MKTTLKHEDADVVVEVLASGKNKISIEHLSSGLFVPIGTIETAYPIELIDKILGLMGPTYLCDEILREEAPDYVQRNVKYGLLSYIDESAFEGKRLLDFGCGSGSSTMILARMFPQTEIVGIELEEDLLSIARLRAEHYGYKNLTLLISPNPDELPPNIDRFDFVVLNAVFEHLLPNERIILLPTLWNLLNPGGILFLEETPYRYYPVETHTTGGVPFINYMPDSAALFCAQKFSKRKLQDRSWEELLRMGIRGGSEGEVLGILKQGSEEPILLNPSRLGVANKIDLWYVSSGRSRSARTMKLTRDFARLVKSLTGITILPALGMAIKKAEIAC